MAKRTTAIGINKTASHYERQADNLPTLRGKLLTGLQATLNAFQPKRFQCEFDEFTIDTPLE